MENKLTIEQFGATVKQKYPQYANFSDAEIGQKTLEKYPEYSDRIIKPNVTSFDPFAGTKNIINTAGENLASAIQGEGQYAGKGPIERGMAGAATLLHTPVQVASNLIPEQVKTGVANAKILPFGPSLGEIGSGTMKGVQGVFDAAAWLGDKIGNTEIASKMINSVPGVRDFILNNVEPALNIASSAGSIAGDILIEDQVSKLAQLGVSKAQDVVKKVTDKMAENVVDKIERARTVVGAAVSDEPAAIMQRVARLPKSQQIKFENMTGKSVGKYLTERNIFGDEEQIANSLGERFLKYKNMADTELAKLPGTFKPAPLKPMLNELNNYVTSTSAEGVPSPLTGVVSDLTTKYNAGGLTMADINIAKRLFERNVKMSYLKSGMINPDNVVKATNMDSALRAWQFKQAKTLGLKNLAEINAETQGAKFLLDEIGKANAGSAANNAITLTDWIVLSGGDPASITAFLIKKGFSAKAVQSYIAKFLNAGNTPMEFIKAETAPSQVMGLPAGTPGSPSFTTGGPTIKVAPVGANIEGVSKTPVAQSTPSTPISPQSTQILSPKSYGSNIANKEVNVKGATVYGQNFANPIDTPSELINGHFDKMKAFVADPTIGPNVNIKNMLTGLKSDIVQGLGTINATDLAKMIDKISIDKFKTLDAYYKAISKLLK